MTNSLLEKKTLTVSEVLDKVDFPVKLGRIFTESGKVIPGKMVVERTDTRQSLGIVSPDYKIIKHVDAMREPLKVLSGEGYKCKGVNFTRGGAKVAIDLISDEARVIDGEKFKFKMHVVNDYSGHWAFKIEFGLFRLICENGAGVWALGGKAKFGGKQIHMGDDAKFKEFYSNIAKQALTIRAAVPEYDKLFASLKKIPVTKDAGIKMLGAMGYGERVVKNVVEQWENKINFAPNAYGLYNGLTSYYSRQAETSKSANASLDLNDKTRDVLRDLIHMPAIRERIVKTAVN